MVLYFGIVFILYFRQLLFFLYLIKRYAEHVFVIKLKKAFR